MWSLRTKLILAFLFVSIIIAIVFVFARWNTSTEFHKYVFNRNQEDFISMLESYYAREESWEGVEEIFRRGPLSTDIIQSPPIPVGEVILINTDFTVLVGGRGYPRGNQAPQGLLTEAMPISFEGQVVGYVILGRDSFGERATESAFLNILSEAFLQGSIVVIAFALLLGFLIARSLTRPLGKITEATRRVAAGDLEFTVDIKSKDELGQLATSFNLMNQRLAVSRDQRRQMTANIAHELRTPVSVILGYADGLIEEVIPPSIETFDLILEQAEQLEHLIEDLRLLAETESGDLTLKLIPINPISLVERALATYEPQAVYQQINLSLNVHGDIPQISIDPDRFRQILSNLISNALRYTPEGGDIAVLIGADDKAVSISVSDTGPGIAPEDLERIFQRFYRCDPSRSRGTVGSGLGLSIAKSLVERQGGQIKVESEVDQGTCFTIIFPRSHE